MAEIIENEKKFKVIKVSVSEIVEGFGGFGICDWCNRSDAPQHYYIAVLHHCYCPECYEEWLERAKHYKEDNRFENKMFKLAKKALHIK